jgi:hypothetical protein
MEQMKVTILGHQQAEEHNACIFASTPCTIFCPIFILLTKTFPSPLESSLLHHAAAMLNTGGPTIPLHTLKLPKHQSKQPANMFQK